MFQSACIYNWSRQVSQLILSRGELDRTRVNVVASRLPCRIASRARSGIASEVQLKDDHPPIEIEE